MFSTFPCMCCLVNSYSDPTVWKDILSLQFLIVICPTFSSIDFLTKKSKNILLPLPEDIWICILGKYKKVIMFTSSQPKCLREWLVSVNRLEKQLWHLIAHTSIGFRVLKIACERVSQNSTSLSVQISAIPLGKERGRERGKERDRGAELHKNQGLHRVTSIGDPLLSELWVLSVETHRQPSEAGAGGRLG